MQIALNLVARQHESSESAEDGRAAFAELVERHARLVYRIAHVVTRNPEDAEDVVQETFLQLYRAPHWAQIEDEQAYLARMAWRSAVRARSLRRPSLEPLPDLPSRAPGPEQQALDANSQAHLHAMIDRLPEKLRQPLALAALGELKLVEVARILDLPEGTVRRRIHSARQILKAQLAAKGGRP